MECIFLYLNKWLHSVNEDVERLYCNHEDSDIRALELYICFPKQSGRAIIPRYGLCT